MSFRMSAKEYRAIAKDKEPLPNKYHAEPEIIDGIRFDSKAEAHKYQELKLDPEVVHVDCHVPVTLPGGVRFKVDFVVYRKTFCEAHDKNDGCYSSSEAVEVKGRETPDFKLKRRLFDEFHPMRPLTVVRRQGKRWVEL